MVAIVVLLMLKAVVKENRIGSMKEDGYRWCRRGR
jgi:hypothetical protein